MTKSTESNFKTTTRDELKKDILLIVGEIKEDRIFDSHFVIRQLLKSFPDKYLNFSSSIKTKIKKTAITNGQIANVLKTKPISDLVEKIEGKFYSESINGKPNSNAGWKKIKPSTKLKK
ncbi:MAG: hypothetical protein FWB90_04530 [Fibromonadales bacterium]|nr:hypothetical protein [Fibromonadales bacterium]